MAPRAPRAAAPGMPVGRAPPEEVGAGADTDKEDPPVDDAGLLDEGAVGVVEGGAVGVMEVAVVLVVVETVSLTDVTVDVDVDTGLEAELPDEEGLDALLEVWRQASLPPLPTVNVAELWVSPILSRIVSSRLVPAGSRVVQVKLVFENDPKLTRVLVGSLPSTRLMM